MRKFLITRYLAQLELSAMSDAEIKTLSGDIAVAAKTSTLVLASTPLQTCVAAITAKCATLATCNKTVDDDHAKTRTDIAAEAVARSDLYGELRTYTTLITNAAKSPADIEGSGLAARGPRPARNTPPAVPELLVNKPPKKGHGKTVVAVGDVWPTPQHYVAQSSLDGVNWAQLGVGHGKTRTVTGPSGSKVWVRFAMVRSGLQSDWSLPIQINIP